jgi:hypothetical protein
MNGCAGAENETIALVAYLVLSSDDSTSSGVDGGSETEKTKGWKFHLPGQCLRGNMGRVEFEPDEQLALALSAIRGRNLFPYADNTDEKGRRGGKTHRSGLVVGLQIASGHVLKTNSLNYSLSI